MNGPNTIHVPNDLAEIQPLHELRVFQKDGKLFAHLLLELRPDAEKALSPVEGEDLLDERGNPRRVLPENVFYSGVNSHYLWHARAVPPLPVEEKKNA